MTLHNEQAALADRARTVLAELRNKGGDVQSYETYITAVSGLSAVSTDSDALRTFVMSWLQSPEGGWPTRPST